MILRPPYTKSIGFEINEYLVKKLRGTQRYQLKQRGRSQTSLESTKDRRLCANAVDPRAPFDDAEHLEADAPYRTIGREDPKEGEALIIAMLAR